jgi:GNAT superfamily N-acetyltransferase
VLGPSPYFTEVQRPRLGEAVRETVAEVRALVRESEHRNPTWWIGDSATPPDLSQRLRAFGFRDPTDRVRELVALAIAAEPAFGPTDVQVRKVETLGEFVAAREIMWEVFETSPEKREAEREHVEKGFRAEQELRATATFLAYLDDSPAAAGQAAYCERGGLLFAGATLPEARGRGAYRALVRARWDEAVRRGTPALVTQAVPSSEPILRRLGFHEVSRLRRLEDPL